MLPDSFVAPPFDMAYLTVSLLTSILAFAVWVTALSISLSLAIFIIGIPVALARPT